MMINYLFVYGTLKPGGEANHYFDQIQGSWFDDLLPLTRCIYISQKSYGYKDVKSQFIAFL